jgi:hypothetical protein
LRINGWPLNLRYEKWRARAAYGTHFRCCGNLQRIGY